MANWICIKEAAKKYGTTEDKIHYLIRMRHITFSYVDDSKLGGDYNDKLLMVNADELNEILDFNAVVPLAFGTKKTPVVRIPLNELNSILQINDDYREVNKRLRVELKILRRKETERRIYKSITVFFILLFSLSLIIMLFCKQMLYQ